MYEIPKIAVSTLLNLDNNEVIPGSIWVTEDLDKEVRSQTPHAPHSVVVHFNQKEQFHVLY
ncbi:MAG: hypothetical protein ACJAX5_001556 [Patiriisocius sp.]|jgi:hypothetical protein